MNRETFNAMLRRASKSVQELNRKLAIEIPYPHDYQTGSESSHSQPEPPVPTKLLGPGQGTAQGAARIVVRLTSFRVRLLDPDNLCPKALVDGLRYAGIIPDDRPQDIELAIAQQKVAHRREERTEIELVFPEE